jgi:hypothetical protein
MNGIVASRITKKKINMALAFQNKILERKKKKIILGQKHEFSFPSCGCNC